MTMPIVAITVWPQTGALGGLSETQYLFQDDEVYIFQDGELYEFNGVVEDE